MSGNHTFTTLRAAVFAMGISCAVTGVATASDLSRSFDTMRTFSADFSQLVAQDGQIVQNSTGTVRLKKPLMFRWDYQTPEVMQLISDGTKFYHYDVDLAQATAKPVEQVADAGLVAFLDTRESLDNLFLSQPLAKKDIVARFPNTSDRWLQHAQQFYLLSPRKVSDDDAQARTIIVGMDTSKQLSVFYAKDAYGENVFFFDKIKQNGLIADKVFMFTAPDGVDVLE